VIISGIVLVFLFGYGGNLPPSRQPDPAYLPPPTSTPQRTFTSILLGEPGCGRVKNLLSWISHPTIGGDQSFAEYAKQGGGALFRQLTIEMHDISRVGHSEAGKLWLQDAGYAFGQLALLFEGDPTKRTDLQAILLEGLDGGQAEKKKTFFDLMDKSYGRLARGLPIYCPD
jgi:hypothetical protein